MNSITLFGASGKTGLEIIRIALNKNFIVKAFCRNKSSISLSHINLKIIEGSVLNPEDVQNAIINSSYVICTLGPKPPYKETFLNEASRNIVTGMKNSNVKRIVCITGAMIGENKDNLSPFMKFLKRSFEGKYPLVAEDRAKQEKVIKESSLDWTILKPPRLSGGKLKVCITGERLKVSALSSVSRKSLAECIINILDDKSYFNKSIMVKN